MELSMEFFKDVAVIVPLTIALTQLVKPFVVEKYYPLASVVFGVLLSLVTFGASVLGLLIGLMIGTSAAGLYDQKAIVK